MSRELQQMYQQWCQGNEDYGFRWLDFVEMAARRLNLPESEILRELQKHYWFVKMKQYAYLSNIVRKNNKYYIKGELYGGRKETVVPFRT